MVEVLVGGKKRGEILANRRDQIERARLEGSDDQRMKGFSGALTPCVSYRDMEIEEIAARSCDTKLSFSYTDSLARLKEQGYTRHMLPSEAYALINEYLDGTHPKRFELLCADLLSTGQEWTGLEVRFETKGNPPQTYLSFFLDPQVLSERESDGVYSHARVGINTQEVGSFVWNYPLVSKEYRLKELAITNPSLVRFLYRRSYEDLPEEVRTGGGLYISSQPLVLTRGLDNVTHYYSAIWRGEGASRGVRGVPNKDTLFGGAKPEW